MYEDEFPARLTQLRTQKGVSARDMSLSIGQNPGYIHNIESGKALPSMACFFFICDYLGVTPSEFFDTRSPAPQKIRAISEDLAELDSSKLDAVASIVQWLK